MRFLLRVLQGAREGSVVRVDGVEVRLGRARDATVVIDEDGVAPAHARIVEKGGYPVLEDLGGPGGTRLNDVPLPARGAKNVGLGDQISIGKTVLRYEPESLVPSTTVSDLSDVAAKLGGSGGGVVPSANQGPKASTSSRQGVATVQSNAIPKSSQSGVRHKPLEGGDGGAAGSNALPPRSSPSGVRRGVLDEAVSASEDIRTQPVKRSDVALAVRDLSTEAVQAPKLPQGFMQSALETRDQPTPSAETPQLLPRPRSGVFANPLPPPSSRGEVKTQLDAQATTIKPTFDPNARPAAGPAMSIDHTAEVAVPRPLAHPRPTFPEEPGGTAAIAAPELEAARAKVKEAVAELRASPGTTDPDGAPLGGQSLTALPTVMKSSAEVLAEAARLHAASQGAGADGLSAADAARLRNELKKTAGGRLQLWWMGVPATIRLFAGVVFFGTVGVAVAGLWYQSRTVKRVEPAHFVPGGNPVTESFGLGEGVDFKHADQKDFSFSVVAPTRVVGILHYSAKDVAPDEVAITLNGADVAKAPADTADSETRVVDQTLPADALKSHGENVIVFDNLKNPPGAETWRVWNVSVEVMPVPELSGDALLQAAKDRLDKAEHLYELKKVNADNTFRSWKMYRETWLMLEADPRTAKALHDLADRRMREIRKELDTRCNALAIDFEKVTAGGVRSVTAARKSLSNILNEFPESGHPCHAFAQQGLKDLEQLSDTEYLKPRARYR